MNTEDDEDDRGGRGVLVVFGVILSARLAVNVQNVVIAWTVYGIAHRTLDSGLVGLAFFVPALAFVFVAGNVADRYDRRIVLVSALACESAASFAYAALLARGTLALAAALTLVFFIGCARAFRAPAERSLLVDVVRGERFVRMQSTLAALRKLVVVAAPALGGGLIALAGSHAASLIGAATLLVASAWAPLLRLPHVAFAEADGSARSAFAGLRFLRSQPVLLGAVTLDLFAVLFGSATALLPVYAVDVLHVGALGFGALRSAPAVGGFVAAVFLVRRPVRSRIGRTLLLSIAGFGVATIVFAFSRSFAISVFALACVGATDMVSVVIRSGIVQLGTPRAMRGRVNAIEAVFIGASNQIGAFESGTLAALIGTVPAVAFGGVATLAIVASCVARNPRLRDADRFPHACEV